MKVNRMRVGVATEGIPRLLLDLVFDILNRQPDFTVVTIEKSGEAHLVESVRENALDILITVIPNADSTGAPVDLLYAQPLVRILGLQGDGRSGALYSLQPNIMRLADVSPTELIAVIRSVASPTPI